MPEELEASLSESLDLPRGKSVLHLLAAQGNDHKLEQLLLAGASAEVQDDIGWTPLHVAAALGHEKVVQTLLQHAAHVHGQASDLLFAGDVQGVAAFHLSAKNGDAHILEQLSEVHHASSSSASILDLRTKKGQTPLHLAAQHDHFEAVCLLLEAGANRDVRDVHGVTPFHRASSSGNTLVMDMLQLESVNCVVYSTQLTALHYAAWAGRIDAIRWLLGHGALVDAMDRDGLTPLHYAAMNGSFLVIECLILEGGANPQQLTSKRGALALGLADDLECHDAAKSLVKAIKLNGQERIKDSLWAVHSSNGATLLHYFAAYGTEDDLRWILALIQSKTAYNVMTNADGDPVNKRDKRGRTAVHWAAMRSNKDVVSVLAEKKANLNAESKDKRYKSPLSLAIINGDMEFAEELLKWKPKTSKADDWLHGIRTWVYEYYLDEDKKLGKKLSSLKSGFIKHTNGTINQDIKPLFSEIPPLYLALHAKRDDIAKFIQRHSKEVEDAVNEKGGRTGRTALHWATLLRQRKIVAQLCRVEVFARELTANAEDKYGKTALQYAKQMKLEDIEKELMLRSDVRSSIDGMYKDRQVYVDAANAILVGAALIAGVTFAGWLQPPLSYTPYYNLPQLTPPSPPDIFQAYAAVQQHMGVRSFWIFNSLSFSFAIATMVAGLVAVVPIPGTYIATSVAHLRRCLLIASALLGLSIVFVLAAFAAAGFAVLPPVFQYQANMMATVIVGGLPCLILLVWFAYRLWSLRPEWVRAIETGILSKLHQSGTPSLPRESESSSSSEEEDNPHQRKTSIASSSSSETALHLE